MKMHQDSLRLASIAALCFLNGGFGFFAQQLPMLLAAASGLTYVIFSAATAREHASAAGKAHLAA